MFIGGLPTDQGLPYRPEAADRPEAALTAATGGGTNCTLFPCPLLRKTCCKALPPQQTPAATGIIIVHAARSSPMLGCLDCKGGSRAQRGGLLKQAGGAAAQLAGKACWHEVPCTCSRLPCTPSGHSPHPHTTAHRLGSQLYSASHCTPLSLLAHRM